MRVKRPSIAMFAGQRPSRRLRRGVSILEVLFAIMVTTIGLLGAIAVFPVASAQARKGRISDALAVAGMSAAHDFDVRGMRRPKSWVAYNSSGAPISPYDEYVTYLTSSGSGGSNWFGGGQTFCIDPRYLAANSGQLASARTFPANTPSAMNRITLDPNMTNAATEVMSAAVAEAIFMFDDDLSFGRPDDRSLNAYQIMDSISGTDYKRQSEGHMSWMATITPKLDRASDDFKDTYVLSVVVFYDRPMDDLANSSGSSTSEHLFSIGTSATGGFPGGGVTGGEVRLTGTDVSLNRVKANDWILLTGITAAGGSGTYQRPVAKWYRVVDVDAEVASGGTERYVTLFGQDWDGLIDTRAVYVEGVVGVYEKTIRLDMTP